MHNCQLYPLFLSICIVSALPADLGAGPTLADSPAFSLAPKDFQQEANREAGSASSPAVVLVDDEHWTFHPDNTIERKQHYIYKVLESSAVQSWSSVHERWEPWHQQRPEFRARVITPDGIAHELDTNTLTDGPAGSNLPQSYSDVRILQGPLPAVEAGSIVEAELVERFTPVLGSLVFRGYIAGQVPVRFSRLSAEYSESLPFRYQVSLCPDFKESKDIRAGIVHLTLEFGSFDALKQPDPLLPFDVPRSPLVTFSTGTSWNDVAVRYGKIIDDRIAGAPVKDLVANATQGQADRSAIIEHLVRALHREIRYTGVEFADAAIIPAKPEETLARKYGDCKDKAALLVAMLRAAGIPSYVAILNAGLEQDLSPRHPGMGMFNHAIVYVPGPPALWIDATAEHMRVGSLPSADEGRLALIIRPETTELVKIAESVSASNVSTATFDYYLPDYGPAHLVQSIFGTGAFDGAYRELAAMLDNGEFRKQIEKQIQSQFDTKAPVVITHRTVDDFSAPFQFTTDVLDTKTVTVSETGATISLPVMQVFSDVPRFFLTDDSKETDETAKNTPRSAGFVLPTAFVQKVLCRAHIPPGFAPKKVPEDQKVKLGPATYSAHYELKDQVLSAEVSLDTEKRTYTLEEGQALKKALLEFTKQPPPVVAFEPQGQTLLDEGHLREGLSAFEALARANSAQAVNHVRLSRAYLAVGCGQEARREAQAAAQIAPNLVVSWRNLAYVHEHDLIGRKYKEGWEPAVVEEALRKAMSLDHDDASINAELGESLEYDARGDRYASLERLGKAVDVFQSMGDEEIEQQGLQDMLLYDLARLGRLDEMKSKLERYGATGSRATYRAFLIALTENGAKAGAELRASVSADELKEASQTTINLLAASWHYQQLVDFATELGSNPPPVEMDENLRKMHHIDDQAIQPDSPENLVKCFVGSELMPDETETTLARFWSASIPSVRLHPLLRTWQRSLVKDMTDHNFIPSVARDVFLITAKVPSENNGAGGFRVRVVSGGSSRPLFVVRENGAWKLLGNAELPEAIARQALKDLQTGNEEAARKWLDWLREDIKLRSEDDPLGGPVFPRIWNRGATASPAQIRYAAASLLHSKDALPILEEAIGSTSDSSLKAYFELAFAGTCIQLKSWPDCLAGAKPLAASFPDSATAQALLARAYLGVGQLPEAERTLKEAIANDPDDLALRRVLATVLTSANRMREAVQVAKEAAETPHATPAEWNEYGWISLFAGEADEEKMHAVERAQGRPQMAMRHTLASMQAEIGKLNEARQTALQALDEFAYKAPDSTWWYVFGRIAEQLGANSSALLYYQRVETETENDDPLSTYALARKRLAALDGARSHTSSLLP